MKITRRRLRRLISESILLKEEDQDTVREYMKVYGVSFGQAMKATKGGTIWPSDQPSDELYSSVVLEKMNLNKLLMMMIY